MDQEIKILSTNSESKKLKNSSSSISIGNKKTEVPVVWEAIQTEYDSGPKMGID